MTHRLSVANCLILSQIWGMFSTVINEQIDQVGCTSIFSRVVCISYVCIYLSRWCPYSTRVNKNNAVEKNVKADDLWKDPTLCIAFFNAKRTLKTLQQYLHGTTEDISESLRIYMLDQSFLRFGSLRACVLASRASLHSMPKPSVRMKVVHKSYRAASAQLSKPR